MHMQRGYLWRSRKAPRSNARVYVHLVVHLVPCHHPTSHYTTAPRHQAHKVVVRNLEAPGSARRSVRGRSPRSPVRCRSPGRRCRRRARARGADARRAKAPPREGKGGTQGCARGV